MVSKKSFIVISLLLASILASRAVHAGFMENNLKYSKIRTSSSTEHQYSVHNEQEELMLTSPAREVCFLDEEWLMSLDQELQGNLATLEDQACL